MKRQSNYPEPEQRSIWTTQDWKMWLAFCGRVQEMVAVEILDLKNINLSDESHFFVNGMSNRQNFTMWSATKPEFQVSIPLHSAKMAVWCGLTATEIIGPLFYENPVMRPALIITKTLRCIAGACLSR